MSRKYRIEEEKAKQLQEEILEDEDKLKQQKEKLFGPLVWCKLSSGIKIIDLQPINYDQAANIILDYFVNEDVIFRNATRFSDDLDSVASFRDKLIVSMMDRSSIIAVTEDDEIAGILILKAVKKSDFGRVFSRVTITQGKPYTSITKFMNKINRKVDVYKKFNCDIYLRYYLLCIKPEYRGKGLGFRLMSSGLDVARHLRISVVMGIFDCWKLQQYAGRLGMQRIYEYNYRKYRDQERELVFCDLGAGNFTCSFMAGKIPSQTTPENTKKVEK
ncbi:uncharacterized protein [Diabrotica undecimpunctata]|uniref:uncharacterized protein n=1 Tax=Diabrotica undecimpunctata TaxID=50387 RepID=UPI003B634396